ncbi:hypothetical protein AV650_26050 [Serratia fonticola]|nr:hypothetical protein AV650_26050 [Serratia fonticola]
MNYFSRSSRLFIGTAALYFFLFLLPRYSLCALPEFGSGIFEYVSLEEYNWHVENGIAVVDSARVEFGWSNVGTYPCESLWLDMRPGGTLVSCFLEREIGGTRTKLATYTNLKQLTRTELQAVIEQTGPMGPVANPRSGAYFMLGIQSTTSNGGVFLPKSYYINGGVPPTEVEPPLSCSISDGTINHGVIDGSITNGHVGRSTVSVWCTKRATVRIKADSYNPANGVVLNGPGELKSFVTLNGAAASTGVTVDANNSASISVESKLQGTGNIAAGSYSGFITLVTTII